MLIGKYHFCCLLESEAHLPHYKGSTFRGVFGRALKRVVCALRLQNCKECLLKNQCLYVHVFESPTLPHPFVIEPPLNQKNKFPPRSAFEFDLILFGDMNKKLPYFVYAFREMGQLGIGRRVNGQRGRFSLEQVFHRKKIIYEKKDDRIQMPDVPDFDFQDLTASGQPGDCIRVTLVTPLRLKYKNRLTPDLPFHVLVRAVLRRISTLFEAYGGGEPPLDYPKLVKDAQRVKVVENNIQWFDWRRYSFRQDREMLMGGLVGSIVYEGQVEPYIPLLEFCSLSHLGKQTTFGLGKIRVEVSG